MTVVQLPLRPPDERSGPGANPQYAPTRPREDAEPARGTPPPVSGEHRKGHSISLTLPTLALLPSLTKGTSLLAAASPAILIFWQGHKDAASYYRHRVIRYPRLAYGAVHAFGEVPLAYLWAWSGRSPALRVTVLATVVIILRLLGIHVWGWL